MSRDEPPGSVEVTISGPPSEVRQAKQVIAAALRSGGWRHEPKQPPPPTLRVIRGGGNRQ